ncbi:uncharacterized protein LOC135940700 [Cloeon dipterum]|uniref:uncharacterized protein LOC135940700 n=1 Tax=Cloeon dipterum TaxID=197152 RepID=UPI0032202AE7
MDRIVQNIVEKASKNINEICVGPLVSDEGMLRYVTLEKSFGYDCKKLYNLCAIEDTVIYVSGNIIHFLNTKTGEMKLQRSVRCTGVGHISANYHSSQLAIGERGHKPSIYVLSWPTLDVVSTLTNGTEKAFVYLDYNHDGTILCSLGGAPDFTLALWDWKKSAMLVKCEAANRCVFKAAFSKVQPDVIISGGEGHIKFWQTAKTFTGVKLTGDIGKFGSSEMSNIVGFEFLADGKVASGCDWGNILIWANNKLSFELTTRRAVTCHQAPVYTFHRHDAWLISIGTDGWVRAWDMEKLNARHDGLYCRNESVVYFTIGENSCLVSKIELPTQPDGLTWLLQDALGAIWLADVGPTLKGEEQAPSICKQLLKCHAGRIISMVVCSFGPFFATVGPNGRILVHNYVTGKFLDKYFEMEVAILYWLPKNVDGQMLIVGFENGSLSLCAIQWENERIWEVQGIRPHDKRVLNISFDQNVSFVVTASDDGRVFLVHFKKGILIPIGYIEVSHRILATFLTESEKLLVLCENGILNCFSVDNGLEIENPKISFKLKVLPCTQINLSDCNRYGDNALQNGFHIVCCNQWTAFELTLFIQTDDIMTIALLDLNNYEFKQIPIMSTSSALQLTCACISEDKSTCLMGFESGEVQLNVSSALDVQQEQQSWHRFWRIRMHESERGCRVSAVSFSHDAAFCFTAGDDGSIFMFAIGERKKSANGESIISRPTVALENESRHVAAKNCTRSVEQTRVQKAEKRISNAVLSTREHILKQMALLREAYTKSQLKKDILVLHPLLQGFLEEKVRLIRTQNLALIEPEIERKRNEWTRIHSCFLQPLQETCLKIAGVGEDCSVESFLIAKSRATSHAQPQAAAHVEINAHSPEFTLKTRMDAVSLSKCDAEETIVDLDALPFRYQRKSVSTANQVAEKLRQRQMQRSYDLRKVDALEKCRPRRSPSNSIVKDTDMGVYKLKTDAEYSVPNNERDGSSEILECMKITKQKMFYIKSNFNHKVILLKKERRQILQQILKSDAEFLINDLKQPDDYLFKLCTLTDLDEVLHPDQPLGQSTDEVLSSVSRFDAKVRALIEERLICDVNICLLKQWNFMLDQKLEIVSHMEAQQIELKESLQEMEDAKKTILENKKMLQEKLAVVEEEVDALQYQIEKLEAEVVSAIEGTAFFEHLILLFRKEYKPPSLSISSSVTEGSDENRSGTSSAGSTCKGVSEKVCPTGCSQDLFDYVNHCRLLRYDINLKLMEKNRIFGLMMKDDDVLRKKLKLSEKNIKCIIHSTDVFYRERQAKINELQIAVPLKLHQIPAGAEFSKCVLISLEMMNKLSAKSGELRAEAAKLDDQYRNDLENLKEVKAKTSAIEEEIKVTNSKIEETMIQRLGRVLDITELEQAVLSCEIENLTKPRHLETSKAELQEFKRLEDEKIVLNKEILLEVEKKKKNSQTLLKLLKQVNSKINPDNSKHKNCSREEVNGRRDDVRRLNELVLAQREQIAAARYELDLLRCKVASSRFLFASTDLDDSTNNEDTDAYQQIMPSRKAPQILIEYCENDSQRSESDEH